MRQRLLIATALLAATMLPAQAMTITARVSGGNMAIHAGPSDRYELVGRVADGTEIPIDQCTQSDSDSRRGSWIGDAGYSLRGADATLWCHSRYRLGHAQQHRRPRSRQRHPARFRRAGLVKPKAAAPATA